MPEKYGVSLNSDSAPTTDNPPKVARRIRQQNHMLLDLLDICPPYEKKFFDLRIYSAMATV